MKNYLIERFAFTEQGARDSINASIASFGVYAVNMLPAVLIMLFIDQLLLENERDSWMYWFFSGVSLLLMYILLSLEYDALYKTTYKESANLRTDIAQTLNKLPLSYFSKHDLSDLSQSIMSDIEGMEHAMSHAIPKVIGFLGFFALISAMLIGGNLTLGLAVVVPTALNFLFLVWSKKVQISGNKKYYDRLRENSEAFQETIEMQQEIKSFNLTEEFKEILTYQMEESEEIHLKSERSLIWILGIGQLIAAVSVAVVVLTGIFLYSKAEISILYLVGYTLAAIKIKDAVDSSSQGVAEIFYLDPKINRLKEIKKSKIQGGEDFDIENFDIVMENVSFSYDGDRKVLSGVSFSAKQGEVTALVGPSGSGKTSILRLVSRLYDYDGGKITIGGKDIKEISTKSLFEKTSIVFQDVTLFNNSFLENIRIGRKNATDEEVKEAAMLANCEEFILKLEGGYDAFIGENGAELSGGERQRLSIARAFLKDAPILILDEISASLDVENEKQIQESLNRLIENKTVIVISHRLKSIEQVDKIVVIDDGKVENIGTHAELKENSPVYRKLIDNSIKAEKFKY